MSKIPDRIILDTSNEIKTFRLAIENLNINHFDFEMLIRQLVDSLIVDRDGFFDRLVSLPNTKEITTLLNPTSLQLVTIAVNALGTKLFTKFYELNAFLPDEDGIVSLPFYFDTILGDDIVLKSFNYT